MNKKNKIINYAKSLKNSILQQAIQGRLVEQREEEGTAKELLEKIKAERQELIKQGKIKEKKPKQLKPITQEEIPFEIPNSWEWVRLGEITEIISDGTHKTPNYVENGIPFLSVQNISSGKFDLTKIKYISNEEHKELIKRIKPTLNDILICRIGTLGKAIKINFDTEFSIFVSLGLIRLIKNINIDYIVYCLNSPMSYNWIDKNKVGGGSHTFKINLEDLNNFLIPLPPLQEQRRIVEKIESFKPLFTEFEEFETRINGITTTLPKSLKNSILQQAIQGKLVEQREEEGTAKELLEKIKAERQELIKQGKIKEKKQKQLKPITQEEIPFEIPSSWEWVRLGEIGFCQTGTTPSKMNKEYYGDKYQFIKPDNILTNGIITRANEFLSQKGIEKGRIVEKNSILMVCIGTIGKVGIVNEDCSCNQQINGITCYNNIYNK